MYVPKVIHTHSSRDYFFPFYTKQECIPVGCVPPACWNISRSIQWGEWGLPSTPRMQTPLFLEAEPTWMQTSPVQTPQPLWTERMTHACENVTFPQTSFAGGKNVKRCDGNRLLVWINISIFGDSYLNSSQLFVSLHFHTEDRQKFTDNVVWQLKSAMLIWSVHCESLNSN